MIDKLVRQEVKEVKVYPEKVLPCTIKMDANENEWGLPSNVRSLIIKGMEGLEFHRYPDSDSTQLRAKLEGHTGVPASNIMVGNGSDELIHYVVKTFVGTKDRVIIPIPAFSMYSFFVDLAGGIIVPIRPSQNLNMDVDRVIDAAVRENAKVVFISNPNNPTGGVLSFEDIRKVVEKCPGIVVVDEAYYEFYGKTVIDWIEKYPNLIVIRTLSKAAALAGIRVGYLAAGERIMGYLDKVKAPYNVNSFSQYVACKALDNSKIMDRWVDTFKEVRQDFLEGLSRIGGINVFPSQANFVLIKVENAHDVWDKLYSKGILVRKYTGGFLRDYIRVTICPPQQNEVFIKEFQKILGEVKP